MDSLLRVIAMGDGHADEVVRTVGEKPSFDFEPLPHYELGERLDDHRKAVLDKHKQLTMTGLYNVLEKVRADEKLTDAEKDVYDAGLIGVLRQI